MEIEAIAGVVGTPPAAGVAAYAREQHLSPSQAGLAAARAREQETPAERAADGDRLAQAHLAAEAERATPDRDRGLEPPRAAAVVPLPHPATTHEPGKGDRIDVYD